MKKNILLVEDDVAIREIISNYLTDNNFNVLEAENGVEAVSVLKNKTVDLAILDIMVPFLNGFELCKYLRQTSMLPIIMLTAKSAESDKLKGYELGADDYIIKPFSPKVLVAKVKALLRRVNHGQVQDLIELGGISLNKIAKTVAIDTELITFTHKEFELLKTLMANPGRVFSREDLLRNIWGYDYEGNTRTVDTHIKRIRAKLGEHAHHIITLIKSGYKFEVRT